MPTFIVQGRYTAEAIRGFLARPENRETAVARLVEAAGGRLTGHYATTGERDFVAIAEAEDIDAAAAAVLAAAAGGGVTGTTILRASTGEEFRRVCEKAGAAAKAYSAPGA